MDKNFELPADIGKWPMDMLRVLRPAEAEQLLGVGWDTITRNYPDLVIRISVRARGIRLGHALTLQFDPAKRRRARAAG
ncbi:MAG: hypothetical protein WA851_27160 [Xanthobacteraceae bacterium]